MEKLLEAKSISKRFGNTQALDQVSFELYPGEVHALMGENGAGKSTLGKIFSGIYQPDGGEMYLEGAQLQVENPKAAKGKGISIVLQEFNMLQDLSVAENLFLANDDYFRGGFLLNKKKMYKHARELLNLFELGTGLDAHTIVKELSIAQLQVLEILKAVDADSKVIILDEPTAALSKNEVHQLFEIVRRLKKERGVGFIIVSHRIEEIFEIADRVTVFRDGKLIMSGEALKDLTEDDLVRAMVGREIKDLYGSRAFGLCSGNEIVMEVKNVSDTTGFLENISFEVRKGEILGLTGLVGAGRTELARCIFGIDGRKSGTVTVNQKIIPPGRIKNAIQAGLGYVPEDRKNDGLILTKSILNNLSIAKQSVSKGGIIKRKQEKEDAEKVAGQLKIKAGNFYQPCDSLSGGNQQKVLLGKWLLVAPKILIVDEPTRGIDISAKSEIYSILNQLSKEGISIVMISSEQPEIIGMCDRVIIMRDGKIAGELKHEAVSEQAITKIATMG